MRYNLKSTPMVYTPGIIKYARAMDSLAGRYLLQEAFPQLPEMAIVKLMQGQYTQENETIQVEVD